jgi:lipopolysaccharide export system protein LptA
MGGVRVELGDQTLVAGQLDTTFRSGRPGERLESLLETAVATGGARLKGDDGALDCGEMRLRFATAESGELFPTRLDAVGDVVIRQERSEVRGDRVIAELGAPPADPDQRTAFVLRELSVRGRAELVDPARRIRARGDEIAARFTGVSELVRATVGAGAGALATVRAAPYSIRGRKIEIDPASQAIVVDGYSELRLRTNRSLQGELRGRAATVKIASTRKLDVNGRENRVRFDGDVVVTAGAERTRADALTLYLEDAPGPEPAAPRPPDALDRLARLAAAALAGRPPQEWAAAMLRERPRRAVGSVVGGRVRKEPVRLVAENAIVESEEYAAGDPQPVVHSSINAARFDIDIVRKLIRTEGQTTLFVTNRRLGQEVAGEREALGLPSALLTKGPSQTVIQSDGGMVYAVGQSSAQRQDTVLFDGGVAFVHRAGREMANLEQMLPQLAGDQAALDALKARNTYMECRRLEVGFTAGGDEPRAGEGVLPRSGPRLAWLIAQDDVYLRDVEGAGTREVNAARIEFDRANSLVKVFGSDTTDARVYYQNRETNRAETPAVGKRFVIDLANNTVRAGEFAGEARR